MSNPARGCMMCHSLYIKANGEMPCWDDVGETLILRRLDENAFREGRASPIFHGSELEHIRESFIAGRDPHPGVCELCAVRGHSGTDVTLHPREMEVLHLEASYLCHLSCTQCIPAKDRRSLKGPPYNMTVELLDGLMRQLRREQVDRIRFIHFEGRGDPLVNAALPDLIALSRSHFPASLIGVTTHCSYPYMPWIIQSALNVLRVSIDGATSESYSKYRIGGSFERAIDFLRKLRDDRIRMRSALRVEWKYILFEWNDSPEEIHQASELSKELQVHLTFVRTHSPGHSKRFLTDAQLNQYLRQVMPGAKMELTFQLRSPQEASPPDTIVAEHVAGLLSLAVERLRAGDSDDAWNRITEALKYDPEVSISGVNDIREGIRKCLPEILARSRFPSTLTWLAGVCREVGDHETSDALLTRYLEMAPNAPDRDHVLSDRLMRLRIRHGEKGEQLRQHAKRSRFAERALRLLRHVFS